MLNLVVEGLSDTEAAKAVVRASGHQSNKVIAKGGVSRLDKDLDKYNQAAAFGTWVVFRDTDGRCPVELRGELLAKITNPSPNFHLRLAHSMTEAWLLADTAGFAKYFGVTSARVSSDPDSLQHAKQVVIQLCRSSRKRDIKSGMVARGDEIGPLYVVLLNDFARNHWNVENAVTNSDSLRRAVERLREIR